MRGLQVVSEVEGTCAMGDPLDGRAIGVARKIAIPMDDMGVGRTCLISGQREAGDEGAYAHLAARIYIGHLAHDEIPGLMLDEVAFVSQPLEVGITTEQCA